MKAFLLGTLTLLLLASQTFFYSLLLPCLIIHVGLPYFPISMAIHVVPYYFWKFFWVTHDYSAVKCERSGEITHSCVFLLFRAYPYLSIVFIFLLV